jgi:hypothetical protein
MRARGETPGDKGRARIAENQEARRFAQQMEQRYGREWRYGNVLNNV